jgi:hypothetical protein
MTKNKKQKTKNKEQRTKNKEQRTKNKEQKTHTGRQRPASFPGACKYKRLLNKCIIGEDPIKSELTNCL